MKMIYLTSLYVFFSFVTRCVRGAEIFAFFPHEGISHYNVPEIYLKALAARGHNVTVVTRFSQRSDSPLPNYRVNDSPLPSNYHVIDMFNVAPPNINQLPFEIAASVLQNTYLNFEFIADLSRQSCKAAFSLPRLQNLLTENRKFDLVVTEIFGADCGAGFAWKFDAPLVSLLLSRRQPWGFDRVANTYNPSYLRIGHSSYDNTMNFFEKLTNTYWHLYFSLVYRWRHNGQKTDEISRQFFGKNTPSVNEIVDKTALVFANNHFTIDQSYPMVPNYIEIGGIHIKKPKPLPQNIQEFMDSATDGVIYFTLGSLVRMSSMPHETIHAFRDAFAEIPQKVLWKFEIDMENIPSNVLISKWFPQNDIFNHPNLKVFIGHGGNSGVFEAIHYGIPMIGIPLFYDQYNNIRTLDERGVAITLDMQKLTKENILSAIKTITTDRNYTERMKRLSNLFHDRPLNALDTAIYWTEYVIRHKGAPHMRTIGSTMPWYQYHLIDVLAFVIVITIFLIYSLIFTFKRLLVFTGNSIIRRKIKTN